MSLYTQNGTGRQGSLEINLDEAHDFLHLLDQNTNKFTFQTFDDDPDRKDGKLARILHGTLEDHADTLKKLSDRGAGIFVMVNEGDGTGRSTENVIKVRGYFADLDGAPLSNLDKIDRVPHIKVESSPGKYHIYWLVDDAPVDPHWFAGNQDVLIKALESDPSVKDLPRVMRLPGFPHQKGKPFITKIIDVNHIPHHKDEGLFPVGLGLNGKTKHNGHTHSNGSERVHPDEWGEEIFEGEGRNKKITRLYGSLKGRMHEQDAYDTIYTFNLRCCNPPLSENELDGIITSINKADARNKAHTKSNGKDEKKEEAVDWMKYSDIHPECVRWLWKDMIALGKLTVIAGMPGQSKSLLTLDLAARVSQGSQMPCSKHRAPQGNVIILSAEDDPGDTIRPRLDAANADVSHIIHLKAVKEIDGKGERSFDLTKDISLLKQTITQVGNVKLIIIDPVSAYFGTKLDTHKDAHVRAVLMPVKTLAEETGTAVITVMHLSKSSHKDAMMRVNASIGFVGAARAAFLVVKDPEDEGCEVGIDQHRLFLSIKNNIGDDLKGLKYKLEIVDLEIPMKDTKGMTLKEIRAESIRHRAQGPLQVPTLKWVGETTLSANDALTPQEKEPKTKPEDEWLLEFLADGPKPQKEVEAAASAAGFSKDKLRRARERWKVRAYRDGFGKGGQWMWDRS